MNLFAQAIPTTAEQAKGWVDKIAAINEYLIGAPLGVLLFVFAIGGGLLLRIWHQFPNRHIPVILIAFTTVFFCFGAPRGELALRIWIIRNILIGSIIGLLAFFAHRLIARRYPALSANDDTNFLPKPNDPPPTP